MKKALRLWAMSLVPLIGAATSCSAWIHSGFQLRAEAAAQLEPEGYAGSVSCRGCHERFYELWAPSHHGLAMQPYSEELGRKELTEQKEDVVVGEYRYRAVIADGTAWVRETGPKGEKAYPIVHALGGKNVYYFLTPQERGRLQVLPVAYDVRRGSWYDTMASAVRHFPDMTDEPLEWTSYAFTFNTSCYSCHVSQLSINYDLGNDTYQTAWAEPGINCETCHGPAEEHVRVCEAAPEGEVPDDLKIIITKAFSVAQTNSMCAPCHAKMRPLTASFLPGDRYFDHFNLTTLEHADFYPDGRDLGENYTYTLWRMSPCVKAGDLDCLHCHTSSGRYRFKKEKPNHACMPCHEEHVSNPEPHTHHPPDSEGGKCVSCHMPMTEFARMRRSDHSMLPPAPAATIAFESPNACNLCHTDQDAAWADEKVREWRERDYQAPVLYRAGLVDAARKREWSRLSEMLEYLERDDRDEIFATSLIRLLRRCEDERKWPVIRRALEDPSPLVRSAAVATLSDHLTPETMEALAKAAGDEDRVVRVEAAVALAPIPNQWLKPEDREKIERAFAEYVAAQMSRPDSWASHYNIGNYFQNRGDLERALAGYRTALRLDEERVEPWVNISMVYAQLGRNADAEGALEKALEVDPRSAEAHYNLGLLLAEEGDPKGAQKHLRAALEGDPDLAQAAYNLGVLLAEEEIDEAIQWCRKALELRPNDPRYAFTLAFYLDQSGHRKGAIQVLEPIVRWRPASMDVYSLLGTMYEEEGQTELAEELYKDASENENLTARERSFFADKYRSLAAR